MPDTRLTLGGFADVDDATYNAATTATNHTYYYPDSIETVYGTASIDGSGLHYSVRQWPIVTYRNGILYADEEPIGPLPMARSEELEKFWDGIEVHP